MVCLFKIVFYKHNRVWLIRGDKACSLEVSSQYSDRANSRFLDRDCVKVGIPVVLVPKKYHIDF